MVFAAVILLFGHWWDFFMMIKPGALHTAHETLAHGAEAAGHGASHFVSGFTIPGLLEIGTMLGFLALFLFFVFTQMAKAPLQAKNDPYYEESVHHHVM